MKVDLGSGELNDTGWHFIEECQKRNISTGGPVWANCKEILQSCIEFYHRNLHRRVRHKKRGHIYQVLGEGEVQVSTVKLSGGQSLAIGLGKVRQRMLTEGDKLIVYRDEQTNKLWLRFPDEFEDGRFEEVKLSIAPIRLEQVVELKGKIIPPEVIQSFNEAIAENFLDGRAQVPQNDVIDKIVKRLGIDRFEIFRRKLLDVEPIFRETGWDVHYDKPGYNEDYEAFFVFKQRREHR